MSVVASNSTSSIVDTQPYSKAYNSLIQKFRSSKTSLSSSSLGRSFERHFAEKNITVDKYLGAGPNSVVYLGTQRNTGKKLVLKVLLKGVVEKAGGLVIKRTIDYNKVHANTGSIAIVHEFGSINMSNFSVVTDYYPKGSLAKLLEANGPLQESVARGMFQSALQGLLHLHKHKLAHRNLKVENLLLDQHNRLVLTDFCFSLIIEDSARNEAVMSTSLPYLAPEIFSKVPYDPIIADVFSFGVCLHIALSDCLPLGPSGKPLGSDSSCWLKPQMENTLSDAAKKCLKWMLQDDVNKRASTLALTQDAWFQK